MEINNEIKKDAENVELPQQPKKDILYKVVGKILISTKYGLRRSDDLDNPDIQPFSQAEIKELNNLPNWKKNIIIK